MSKFYGDAKQGVSTTIKSAQSKKCRLLKAVETGECGLSAARQIWEGDSGLRSVCSWQDVLDRKEGRTAGRRNGEKRTTVLKLKSGDDWQAVARIKVDAVFVDYANELSSEDEYEDDEELRELQVEADRLEQAEAAEAARIEAEAARLMAREAKLAELRARVARFNKDGQE